LTKRLFDIAVSFTLLLILSPLLLGTALAIWIAEGRPILFKQRRPGLHGQLFTIYKFRTMRPVGGLEEGSIEDASRLTGLGSFLRSTSIDELPELWNILIGDMSLVGPRPLLAEYLPHYSPQQCRRHDVRPGLTGWAQVNGRNLLSWEQKFALDLWYVDNISFRLDLLILWSTLFQIASRRGIAAEGHATMPPFRSAVERMPIRKAGEDE
jgi:lipopolysaccharide/colanic/teichoic acid biosynthesis glycosyltransferase